jgi:hypothetical protein
VNNILYIDKGNEIKNCSIEIFALNGSKIMSKILVNSQNSIDLGPIVKSGVYLLIIKTEVGSQTFKLLINR